MSNIDILIPQPSTIIKYFEELLGAALDPVIYDVSDEELEAMYVSQKQLEIYTESAMNNFYKGEE